MSQSKISAEYTAFDRGLMSDANPINFPEGATLDEENFTITNNGTRKRRLGIDYEEGFASYETFGLENTGLSSHKWLSVGGDGNKEYLVVQTGNLLTVFNSLSASISQHPITSFAPLSGGDELKNPSFAYKSTNISGDLVLITGTEVIIRMFVNSAGIISFERKRLSVRDTWGIFDDTLVEQCETVSESVYSDEEILQCRIDAWRNHDDNIFRQFALWYCYSLEAQRTTVTNCWTSTGVNNQLYNLYNQGWYSGQNTGTPGSPTASQDPVTYYETTHSAKPTNKMSPITAVSSGGVRYIDVNLVKNTPFGDAPAPRGHYIIDLFDRTNSRIEVSGLTGVEADDSDSGGIGTITSFSGRVFYAGITQTAAKSTAKSPGISSFVLFSQLYESPENLARCYQSADPTSDYDSDLVATDGGVIPLLEAGRIHGLTQFGHSLLVIAENGVWEIRGGRGGFSATDYAVRKISNYGGVGSESIVAVGDSVLYWSQGGIVKISRSEFNGELSASDITENRIESLMNSLTTVAKRHVRGVYNSYSKEVRWLYNDDENYSATGDIYRYNKELVYNTTKDAFFKNGFSELPQNSPFIADLFVKPAFDSIIAEDLLYDYILANDLDTWVNSGTYLAGDLVQDPTDSLAYRALRAGGEAVQPSLDAGNSYWTTTSPQVIVTDPVPTWSSSGTDFVVGDIVIDPTDSLLYVAIQNGGQIIQPNLDTDQDYWELYTKSSAGGNVYVENELIVPVGGLQTVYLVVFESTDSSRSTGIRPGRFTFATLSNTNWLDWEQHSNQILSSDLSNWSEDTNYITGNVIIDELDGSTYRSLSNTSDIKQLLERTNPKSFNVRAAAYNGSVYAVVGQSDGVDGYLVTSPDGKTWTERTNPKNKAFRGITYGNGLFVAVGQEDGSDAYILTSPDGITWTERSNPKNFMLNDVIYAESLFVAVGQNDGVDAYIVTSPDGITWTERTNPLGRDLNGVSYGGGTFMAVGSKGSGSNPYVTTSADGITWVDKTGSGFTEQTNPLNQLSRGGTYFEDESLHIIVGNAGYIITSPDGVTWTQRTAPGTPVRLNEVATSSSTAVAVGVQDGTDTYIIRSTDGINWSEISNPINTICYDVIYDEKNNFFWAVGGGGASPNASHIYRSTNDGATWEDYTDNTNNLEQLYGVATDHAGNLVAVGNDEYIISSSDNGANWTERRRNNGYATILYDVHYANGLWVAVGMDTSGGDSLILTSTDMITWTERANPKTGIDLFEVDYGNNLWIAVGEADGADAYIITSPDGITWTEASNPKNFSLYTVYVHGSKFYAAGWPDGTDSYLISGSLVGASLNDVDYGSSGFIGVGDKSTVLSFTGDGSDWIARSTPDITQDLHGVQYTPDGYVAAGGVTNSAYVITSTDEVSWSEIATPLEKRLLGVDYVGNELIITGDTNGTQATILTYGTLNPSLDSSNWVLLSTADTSPVDAAAYMITGYLVGDVADEESGVGSQRQKQVKYLTVHMNRTETGFKEVDGELEPVNPSSCLIQSQWNWANHANSNKYGTQFEAYRLLRDYLPADVDDGFDYGQGVITTKNKLRGRGRALSLRIDTSPGKDLQLLGFGVNFTINNEV